jgi:hypothetical protein
VITVNRIDSSNRPPLKMLAVGLMVGAVAVSASACGGPRPGRLPRLLSPRRRRQQDDRLDGHQGLDEGHCHRQLIAA